ncbi:Hypothetical protein A7982_04413 [Minicystis rosea]|nr:Hypothetical protein A7982_04413 [Minicystis rosea]
MPILRPLALALTLSAACGCSRYTLAQPDVPTSPFVSPPPDSGRICVFRTSVLAQAVTFPVHDNGVLVGATRGPSSFCYLAAPGHHVITTDADEPEHAEIVVERGGHYFLEQHVEHIFGWIRCRTAWVDESVARDLATDAPEVVLVSVPGREQLPPRPPLAPAL